MPSISVRLRAHTLPLVPAALTFPAVALHVAPDTLSSRSVLCP